MQHDAASEITDAFSKDTLPNLHPNPGKKRAAAPE